MKATPESILSLAARTAMKIGTLDPDQSEVDKIIQCKDWNHPYWQMIEGVFRPAPVAQVEVVETKLAEQSSISSFDKWKSGVVKLYKDFVDIDVTAELEKFEFPAERPAGFNWFVFRPQGLTTRTALDKLCKPQFKVEEYVNPSDYSLERDPDQSHLVLCRETVEPDGQWLNHSGDDMSTTETSFLDLCDRVVLEAIYFLIFKKHLDIKGATRCPRSRFGDDVALACWAPDHRRFGVDANDRDGRGPCFGGREAIPLTLKTS